MNKLQARYNAEAGIELSLLRIHIFKAVEGSLSTGLLKGTARPFLDKFWSFPFIWPLPFPEDILKSEKETLQNITKQSFMKGSYQAIIFPEDGKVDVNDLSSPLNALRRWTYTLLLNHLLLAREESQSLKDKYDQKDFEEILSHLADWTDRDNESQTGGREEFIEEGKKPLNRSFISMEEIQKVPKISPEIYEILKSRATMQGVKALNINYADRKTLEALNIPDEGVERILSRTRVDSREYEPFLNQKDFCDFMSDGGMAFCESLKETYQSLTMLTFDYPLAFRIISQGEYRDSRAELEALLYDLSPLALNYQKSRYDEMQRLQQAEGEGPRPQTARSPLEPGADETKKPKLDYSYHKSLTIIYLKENI